MGRKSCLIGDFSPETPKVNHVARTTTTLRRRPVVDDDIVLRPTYNNGRHSAEASRPTVPFGD